MVLAYSPSAATHFANAAVYTLCLLASRSAVTDFSRFSFSCEEIFGFGWTTWHHWLPVFPLWGLCFKACRTRIVQQQGRDKWTEWLRWRRL